MIRILFAVIVLAAFGFTLACQPSAAADSPGEAYKRLYAAVKAKNTDAIKAEMTQKTQEFAQMVAGRSNKPIEKVFENGFTATTFAEALPEVRDERKHSVPQKNPDGGETIIEMGAVEVYNAAEKRWEDLPFALENGAWKLAIGEAFGGTFVSPGKGRSMREQEAANAANGGSMAPANVIPMNANVIVPKAATNASNAAADKKK